MTVRKRFSAALTHYKINHTIIQHKALPQRHDIKPACRMDYKIIGLPAGNSIEAFVELLEPAYISSEANRPAIGAKVTALIDVRYSCCQQATEDPNNYSFLNDIKKLEVGDVLYSIDGRFAGAISFNELKNEMLQKHHSEQSASSFHPNVDNESISSSALLTLVFESNHRHCVSNEVNSPLSNTKCQKLYASPIHNEELSLSASPTSFYSASSSCSKSYCSQGETQQQQLLRYNNLSAISEEGSKSVCKDAHQTPHPFNDQTVQKEQCNEISPLGLSFVESPITPSAMGASQEVANTSMQSTRSFSSRGVSMYMLNFDYVSQCSSPSKLRSVVDALGEDPLKYPSLYKLASDRLLKLEGASNDTSKDSVFSLQYTPSQKSEEVSSLFFTPSEFAAKGHSPTSSSKQQLQSTSKRNQSYKYATRPFNMANMLHDLDLNSSHISPVSSFDDEITQDVSDENSGVDTSGKNTAASKDGHISNSSGLLAREECSSTNTSIDEINIQISAIREKLSECTSNMSAASMSAETSHCSISTHPRIFIDNRPQSNESTTKIEKENHVENGYNEMRSIMEVKDHDSAENNCSEGVKKKEAIGYFKEIFDELTDDLQNARICIEKLENKNSELQDIARRHDSGQMYEDQDFVFKSQLVIAQSAIDAMARELAISQIDLQQMTSVSLILCYLEIHNYLCPAINLHYFLQ